MSGAGRDNDVPALAVPRRPANARKRIAEPGEDEEEKGEASLPCDEPVKIIRRDEKPAETSANSSASASDDLLRASKLEYEFGTGSVNAPARALSPSQRSANATASVEEEREADKDHRAIRERAAAVHRESLGGRYLGQNNYYQYIERHDTTRANALSDKNFRAGPMRMASNIRNICRFDYAPDLCKDYNETGFCGFGDSCKFLHDRGDYKAGWELDEEWEREQERAREGRTTEEDYTVGALPAQQQARSESSACGICAADPARSAVVTRCGHRFCERCALASARDSRQCRTCGTVVDGQFKVYKASKQ